jgi:hypothetical protein
MNAEIETLFEGFTVNGVSIPVSLLFYEGHGEPYVVYMQYDKDNSYSSEDEISGYVTYYDFEVYSKGNYLAIIEQIKTILKDAGWTWQPRRDSPDFFDKDTGYFHKTICFAYPIQIVDTIDDNTQNNNEED